MNLYKLFIEVMSKILAKYPPVNAENLQVRDALDEIRKWLYDKEKRG